MAPISNGTAVQDHEPRCSAFTHLIGLLRPSCQLASSSRLYSFFCDDLLQYVLVQRQIRNQTLQLGILVTQLTELGQLRDAHSGILFLPVVKRRFADPYLSAYPPPLILHVVPGSVPARFDLNGVPFAASSSPLLLSSSCSGSENTLTIPGLVSRFRVKIAARMTR